MIISQNNKFPCGAVNQTKPNLQLSLREPTTRKLYIYFFCILHFSSGTKKNIPVDRPEGGRNVKPWVEEKKPVFSTCPTEHHVPRIRGLLLWGKHFFVICLRLRFSRPRGHNGKRERELSACILISYNYWDAEQARCHVCIFIGAGL